MNRLLIVLALPIAVACSRPRTPPPDEPAPTTLAAATAPVVSQTSPNQGHFDTATRFVALGDTGKGNDVQYAVAAAMKTVCEARGGCAFGLLLGDNFYPSGVLAVDDEQFRTKFEEPYANLPFAFHPVLGNHDYGANGAGIEYWKGQSEIDYSRRSTRWLMPAAYYTFHEGFVDFFALDTNGIVLGFGDDKEQEHDIPRWIANATGPWKIAFGHHMYRSNGPHGNAGAYDRVALDFIPSSGKAMKDFVEKDLCGKVDAYLCGHDHSLQDLGAVCGTQFLVSGGGASATSVSGLNHSEFQAEQPGFLLVEATGHSLAFRFYDRDARLLHTREITK